MITQIVGLSALKSMRSGPAWRVGSKFFLSGGELLTMFLEIAARIIAASITDAIGPAGDRRGYDKSRYDLQR
ncbi:hypothetical protein O206_19800 [Ochrobactrum sp. EGD-AQ16]|nr:hypothetical protein O206_19800 [Ochrobactrum sp. EGD-AQ16]